MPLDFTLLSAGINPKSYAAHGGVNSCHEPVRFYTGGNIKKEIIPEFILFLFFMSEQCNLFLTPKMILSNQVQQLVWQVNANVQYNISTDDAKIS